MDLNSLLNQDKVIRYQTTKKEVEDLIKVIERDIEDSSITGLSNDRKFITAYNAILQATTILIYINGYKVKGEGHHYYTFICAKNFIDKSKESLMDYFNAFRSKRNTSDYDRAGIISDQETNEIIQEAIDYFEYIKEEVKKSPYSIEQ